MAVAVLFTLQVAGQVTLGEGDLAAALDAVRDKLDPAYLVGQLVLLASGQPVAYVQDDLEFTVQQVLEGIPELAAGRSFAVGFSDAPGRVALTPDGGTLRVTGEYFKPLAAPAAELLPALLGCCERFVAFARSAYADQPEVQARIGQLDPWLAGARAALGGAGTA